MNSVFRVPMVALVPGIFESFASPDPDTGRVPSVKEGERFFARPERAAELIVMGAADLLSPTLDDMEAVARVDDPEITRMIEARTVRMIWKAMAVGMRPGGGSSPGTRPTLG